MRDLLNISVLCVCDKQLSQDIHCVTGRQPGLSPSKPETIQTFVYLFVSTK